MKKSDDRFEALDLIILDGFIRDNYTNETISDEEEIVDLLNKLHRKYIDLKKSFDIINNVRIDLGNENNRLEQELLLAQPLYSRRVLEKENKELKDKNSQLQETLAFRSNQLTLMERLVDDLGSEEMARQMEEILNE